MIENQLYDKKSIRSVVGPRADFKELAKDYPKNINIEEEIR